MGLEAKTVRYKLKDLNLLKDSEHENARFMSGSQYRRLVENIKTDGIMTSTPLLARIEGDDTLYVASGNHRVQAAI